MEEARKKLEKEYEGCWSEVNTHLIRRPDPYKSGLRKKPWEVPTKPEPFHPPVGGLPRELPTIVTKDGYEIAPPRRVDRNSYEDWARSLAELYKRDMVERLK